MKRYDEKVLNGLIDRYERSSLMRGTNKVNVSISFPINKRTLPEYFDETSNTYVDIHTQLEALEQQGLIVLVWKGGHQGHILEKCLLQPAKLSDMYIRLGRTARTEKETEIRNVIKKFLNEDLEIYGKPLENFCLFLLSRLDRGESIKAYADLDDYSGLRRLLTLIKAILNHWDKPDSFLREFSIETFHDSKLAEPEIVKAAHIIRDFAEKENFKGLEADDLLSEFNIYRNPTQIMMKGSGTIRISSLENMHYTADAKNKRGSVYSADRLEAADDVETVNLKSIPGGIAITNEAVPAASWMEKNRPGVVLTIENLTSYYRFHTAEIHGKPVLCLYLGGYANHIRRDFLHKIFMAFPEAEYLHFGDIDCGGFRIYRHLLESTGIPFRPYLMDLITFQKYEAYGRKLSENDEKALKLMLQDPFYKDSKDLFEAMIKDHRKLEQECIMEI